MKRKMEPITHQYLAITGVIADVFENFFCNSRIAELQVQALPDVRAASSVE